MKSAPTGSGPAGVRTVITKPNWMRLSRGMVIRAVIEARLLGKKLLTLDADIAILRTLGASPASVMAIFVLQGSIIGLVGLAAGVAGGLAIAHNLDVVIPALETLTGATLWNKEIYYINELPSKVLPADVIGIVSVSFMLTLLAALYPSWRASKVNPAEALRYE